MIDINLVPPEYRKKKRKGLFLAGVKIPPEVVIGSVGGLVFILIVAHIILLGVNITKLTKRESLQKSWDEILPEKEKVDKVLEELRRLQKNLKNVKQLTTEDRILWAKKMNILSDSVPRGVWLKRISLDEGILYVEGSAISKEKKEIINVHSFISALKDNKEFLEHFYDLELGSIQRRYVQKIEVADFLITTKLKQ